MTLNSMTFLNASVRCVLTSDSGWHISPTPNYNTAEYLKLLGLDLYRENYYFLHHEIAVHRQQDFGFHLK